MQETKKMNSQTIGALIGVVIVVIAIIVVGIIVTKNSITATEFNKIENGMTYEEVVEIIGAEGELGADASYGGYSSAIYTWKGVLYMLNGANANVTFSNGRVVGKASIGLIF